jgi:hypothetical protein
MTDVSDTPDYGALSSQGSEAEVVQSTGQALGIGCAMAASVMLGLVLGAGLLWFIMRDGNIPGPAPGPGPAPTPVSPLADEVASALSSDGATANESAQLAALFAQFADSLMWDGKQQLQIDSPTEFEQAFHRLLTYRFVAADTPIGTKFPHFEKLVSTEIKERIQPGPFDDARRQIAVTLFNEVATAAQGYE